MCGIVGLVGPRLASSSTLAAMVRSIHHRGPDDQGMFECPGAVLGMTRLAIIDIEGGDQPKSGRAGQLQVVYNGELYNHLVLRRELRSLGFSFSTRSDTEVVVRSIEAWGLEAFDRFDGMYAIAAYEIDRDRLILARDRFGEKPLYVWERPDGVAFASEPKAFRALGPMPSIDHEALSLYLHLGFIPAPWTMWRDIRKLEAGEILELDSDGLRSRHVRPLTLAPSGTSAADELELRLQESVESRMIADVDVGVLLSGGIDSTLVATCAARVSPGTQSFTVGFDDLTRDERSTAEQTAARLGLRHRSSVVTAEEALRSLPDVARTFDEPFGDQSALPTLWLCRFASEYVKVVLSGDGGDEVFSGYDRYRDFMTLSRLSMVPRWAATLGGVVAQHSWARPRRAWRGLSLVGPDPGTTYLNRLAKMPWRMVATLMPGSVRPVSLENRCRSLFEGQRRRGPQLVDLALYLPDDLMTKTDRASMSTSLEVRAPFLRPDLATWGLGLPDAALPPGEKRLPRQLVERIHGRSLASLPKRGFGPPAAVWLRGALRERLLQAINEGELTGQLDRRGTTLLLHRLDAGLDDAASPLWMLLMLDLWSNTWT